jgi:hypothetical protein
MDEAKMTIGQAIDQIISALSQLDEKSRIMAINVACKQIGIDIEAIEEEQKEEGKSKEKGQPAEQNSKPSTTQIVKDIRMLKEEKNPQNNKQMACLVAYYLRDIAVGEEHKDTISTTDIDKYFKLANYPLPEQVKDVLQKTKLSGYLDEAGRGKYKLNAIGYNLVVHNLPEKTK